MLVFAYFENYYYGNRVWTLDLIYCFVLSIWLRKALISYLCFYFGVSLSSELAGDTFPQGQGRTGGSGEQLHVQWVENSSAAPKSGQGPTEQH